MPLPVSGGICRSAHVAAIWHLKEGSEHFTRKPVENKTVNHDRFPFNQMAAKLFEWSRITGSPTPAIQYAYKLWMPNVQQSENCGRSFIRNAAAAATNLPGC
jgi:hypothetical protein